ncbi:hypothetical protein GF327_06655, partial [Candidatus Woesearchaeota archaeon]|nr:hypothetical protein [Candidatus Woesearchaeota archaeon]
MKESDENISGVYLFSAIILSILACCVFLGVLINPNEQSPLVLHEKVCVPFDYYLDFPLSNNTKVPLIYQTGDEVNI